MLKQVNVTDLENLQFEMECSVNLLCAVHTAMVCGEATADSFTDALFGLMCYQQTLVANLRNLYTMEDALPHSGEKQGGSRNGK